RPASLKAINLEYYASSECSDTLIATQKNVNIYAAELIVVKMEEHKKFGYVSHEFRGDTIYNSALIYVDKAVRLTGSFECPPQYNHREYDLNFVYGWNMRYACFTPDGKYYKETTTNPGKANLHIVNN
ncbi:MAG TPA: hypothetical protein VHP30_13255, partial [Ignavibacteriales bacterium]|nr:hypothetical protein [Ignavibacteriales bacterium]